MYGIIMLIQTILPSILFFGPFIPKTTRSSSFISVLISAIFGILYFFAFAFVSYDDKSVIFIINLTVAAIYSPYLTNLIILVFYILKTYYEKEKVEEELISHVYWPTLITVTAIVFVYIQFFYNF